MFQAKPTIVQVRAVLIALIVGLFCTSGAAASTTDALLNWTIQVTPKVRSVEHPTKTAIEDHFGSVPYIQWKGGPTKNGLAFHGIDLPTAGSGSIWVYDPVHHIAASSFGGDVSGDNIFYSPPPPSKIPAIDLSKTVSAHGLRLGITPSQAERDLGVSPGALNRIDDRTSQLSVAKIITCHFEGQTGDCWESADVLFRDGKATYIELAFP